MLIVVLCSFCTLNGKYFFKLNQRYTFRRWYGELFSLVAEDIKEIQTVGEDLS